MYITFINFYYDYQNIDFQSFKIYKELYLGFKHKKRGIFVNNVNRCLYKKGKRFIFRKNKPINVLIFNDIKMEVGILGCTDSISFRNPNFQVPFLKMC